MPTIARIVSRAVRISLKMGLAAMENCLKAGNVDELREVHRIISTMKDSWGNPWYEDHVGSSWDKRERKLMTSRKCGRYESTGIGHQD